MTKPNRYILNSDYLSIGRVKTQNVTVTFPAVYFPNYGENTQTIEYSLETTSGVIINSLVRANGGNWNVGNTWFWERIGSGGSSYLRYVSMNSANNNKIIFTSYTSNAGTGYSVTVPAVTVDFKITFFKSPNVT